MKTGDIVLIPFSASDLAITKVRPAVVIYETKDSYKDLVVSVISSVAPKIIAANEILIKPTNTNHLRATSIIKVDIILTIKREDVILRLGKLGITDLNSFKQKFHTLIDT